MRLPSVLSVLAAGLCLAACQPAHDDASFDAKVKAYLMSHPEELRDALLNMQTKQQDDQTQAALPTLRTALEHDPRDFVANPNGKVTVTEFYDYRCPHCINMASQVVALIRTQPNVRFVFKEMPIFGSTSDYAARAALAAKAQGKDYVGLYEAFMSTRPLTDQDVDRLATAKGIDLAAIKTPEAIAKDQAQLDDTNKLASKLDIDGTPGFIVGDTVIRGEDTKGLADAIAAAEHKA